MRLLDEHFAAGGQFITGEFFTLADVVVGSGDAPVAAQPIDKPHLDALAWLLPAPVGPPGLPGACAPGRALNPGPERPLRC
jgi:hypothetical protein